MTYMTKRKISEFVEKILVIIITLLIIGVAWFFVAFGKIIDWIRNNDGTVSNSNSEQETKTEIEFEPFVLLEGYYNIDGKINGNSCYQYVLYDPETKIMYTMVSSYHRTGMTVILNADGTPKLYDPEEEKTE